MNDLVVLSLEPWDGVWRRNQYLVAGLLQRDPRLRVLFVEPAADPLFSATKGELPRRGSGLREVSLPGAEGRLWAFQPTKWLPRKFDGRADFRAGREIRRQAQRLGFRQPILWVNDPAGAATLEVTGWSALYDITDDWLEADRTPAEHERLVGNETLLMKRCAEVVVCSDGLVRTKGPIRPVTLIPNAVDLHAYRTRHDRPEDLPEGPVALYLGTVHTDRIDLALCVATARALGPGGGRLVLVGPAPLRPVDTQSLIDAGVVMLGAKDRAQVPAYLQHADALVVPHVVTPFTESLDPIKLYEYRAAGKPVVSTPVAGFRDCDDPTVRTVPASDFPVAVAEALVSPSPLALEPAVIPSWDDRVEQMAQVLARLQLAKDTRRLKIIVDVLSAPAESGGMRLYAEEVLRAWHEVPGAQDDELLVHGEPWIVEAFARSPLVRCVPVQRPNKVRRLTHQWFRTAKLSQTERADAVLSLGPVVTGLVPRAQRFCVVHDWRHKRRPEEFSLLTRLYRLAWLHSVGRAGGVVVISAKTERETKKHCPNARTTLIPNGTDHPKRWNVSRVNDGIVRIVTFGHHSNKRPDLVLRAFARLPSDLRSKSCLVILGAKGALAEQLRTLAFTSGVGELVQLPGFVEAPEYQSVVAGASVVVLASTDEGFGLPVVEAQYFGVPVVATSDSGLGELHGDRVVSTDPEPTSIAAAIELALAGPRSMGAAATRWVETASAIRGILTRTTPGRH